MNQMILTVPRGRTKYSVTRIYAELSGVMIFRIDSNKDVYVAPSDYKDDLSLDRINSRLTLEGTDFITVLPYPPQHIWDEETFSYDITTEKGVQDYINGAAWKNIDIHRETPASGKSLYLSRRKMVGYNSTDPHYILEDGKWKPQVPWNSCLLNGRIYNLKEVDAIATTLGYVCKKIPKRNASEVDHMQVTAVGATLLRDSKETELATATMELAFMGAMKELKKGKKK